MSLPDNPPPNMNSLFRLVPAALALGLALVPMIGRAVSPSAESRVARLDALVQLSSNQQTAALLIFAHENAVLDSLATPEERVQKGSDARLASRTQIRAVLTPEQRKKYDISPQTLGGGSVVNPESFVDRLHQAIPLNAEQKTEALQIIWHEHIDQVAATPPDQAPKGFFWSQAVRDQLRAILTPEQQAKFDATPPYRSSGPRSAKTGG